MMEQMHAFSGTLIYVYIVVLMNKFHVVLYRLDTSNSLAELSTAVAKHLTLHMKTI
jgi:hypothetical protein